MQFIVQIDDFLRDEINDLKAQSSGVTTRIIIESKFIE